MGRSRPRVQLAAAAAAGLAALHLLSPPSWPSAPTVAGGSRRWLISGLRRSIDPHSTALRDGVTDASTSARVGTTARQLLGARARQRREKRRQERASQNRGPSLFAGLAEYSDPRSVSPRNPAAGGGRPGGRGLVHAFNLYDAGPESSLPPLGYEQWAMLASVRSSADAFRSVVAEAGGDGGTRAFDSVSIVCAVIEQDVDALRELTDRYCDHVSVLGRSIATEYPEMNFRSIPFVQDIIDAGMEYAADRGIDASYYMYTNSDISATLEFYTWLEGYIRTSPKDNLLGIKVNRMTIDIDKIPLIKALHEDSNGLGSLATMESQDLMARRFVEEARSFIREYATEHGGRLKRWGSGEAVVMHPGHDCFVFHSSVVQAFDFGGLYIGTSPLSYVHRMMDILLGEAHVVETSSHVHGTFHLGDDQAWKEGWVAGTRDYGTIDAWAGLHPDRVGELANLLSCPDTWGGYQKDLFSLQGYMNCGKLFAPREGGVPNFVRRGHEGLFWRGRAEGEALDIEHLRSISGNGMKRQAGLVRKKLREFGVVE